MAICIAAGSPAGAAQFWVDYSQGSDSYDGSAPVHGSGSIGPFKTVFHATGTQAKRAKPGDTVCVISTAPFPHQGAAYGGALGNPIVFDGSGCGYNVANGLPPQARIVADDAGNDAFYINTRSSITTSAIQPDNNTLIVSSLLAGTSNIVVGSLLVGTGAASLPTAGALVTAVSGNGPYLLSLSAPTASLDAAGSRYVFVSPTRTHDIVIKNFEITAASAATAKAGIMTGFGVYNLSVIGNYIHDVGGNGINCTQCDRVVISGNVIANNATYTCSAHNSGISLLGPTDIDPNTGLPNGGDASPSIKIVISNNYVYGNYNKLCGSASANSDGNGMIVPDDGDNVYGPASSPFPYYPGQWFDPAVYAYGQLPYKGQIAVYNNVVYGNGGPGIHSYKWTGAPVGGLLVMHNTLLFNLRDPYLGNSRAGDISLHSTPNAIVLNNVVVTDGATSAHTGRHTAIQLVGGSVNAIVKNNWMNSASVGATLLYTDAASSIALGTGNQSGEPLLMAPPSLAAMGLPLASSVVAATDLRPQAASPILGLGDTTLYAIPADVLTASRSATAPTLGSYEH